MLSCILKIVNCKLIAAEVNEGAMEAKADKIVQTGGLK